MSALKKIMPRQNFNEVGTRRVCRWVVVLLLSLATPPWLQAEEPAAEKSPEGIMKNNPFGLKVAKAEMLEWINIMFAMAMKYAMAVLEGKAWLPPSPAE